MVTQVSKIGQRSNVQGHLSVRLKEGSPHNLSGVLADKLSQWTGQRWMISLSREQGEPTIAETRLAAQKSVDAEVRAHPIVAEILKQFFMILVLKICFPTWLF